MPLASAPTTVHLITRWANETVSLHWGRYENGRLALDFLDVRTGEPISRATVNLPDEPLAEGETFIPSHSENEGMVEALTKLGLIERTGRVVSSGFVEIDVCRWLMEPQPDVI